MAVSKQEASTGDTFHENQTRDDGTCYQWRRNGATQTWKTRPDEFRTPIKYGLRGYGQLTQTNAGEFHTPADCPNPEQTRRPRSRTRASR